MKCNLRFSEVQLVDLLPFIAIDIKKSIRNMNSKNGVHKEKEKAHKKREKKAYKSILQKQSEATCFTLDLFCSVNNVNFILKLFIAVNKIIITKYLY